MSMALTHDNHNGVMPTLPAATLLAALGKPFAHEAIKTRPGGMGKPFSYVAGYTIIHRLNDATGGMWDWEIKSFEFRPLPPTSKGKDQWLVVVTGTLGIPGLGSRSGVGVQVVVDGAGEDLVKGASTDALKKAATLFGVALELYGEDYEDEPAPLPEPTPMVKLKVEEWPDDRLLVALGQGKAEPQMRRLLTVYLGRGTDKDTLTARTIAARNVGPGKETEGHDTYKALLTEVALARAKELKIPPKQPAPPPADDLTAVVGEPEGDPQARRRALLWATAAQYGWDEARVRSFGKSLYQSDDLTRWSAGQLDSFITYIRNDNRDQAAG